MSAEVTAAFAGMHDQLFDAFGVAAMITLQGGAPTQGWVVREQTRETVDDGVGGSISVSVTRISLRSAQFPAVRRGDTIQIGSKVWTVENPESDDGTVTTVVVR